MSDCIKQWKLDVNDRYSRGVGVVISLSSASLILPIFFLNNIEAIETGRTLASYLTCWVYFGWGLLGLSILAGIYYYYLSAKWTKLAWDQPTHIWKTQVSDKCVENLLDNSYFMMMAGFVLGLIFMIIFMITFIPT